MRYLLVWADYMSTGVRDEFSGAVEPSELGLNEELANQLADWVARYEKITPLDESERISRIDEIRSLDEEGVNFVREISNTLGNEVKVSYFSEGMLKNIYVNELTDVTQSRIKTGNLRE